MSYGVHQISDFGSLPFLIDVIDPPKSKLKREKRFLHISHNYVALFWEKCQKTSIEFVAEGRVKVKVNDK